MTEQKKQELKEGDTTFDKKGNTYVCGKLQDAIVDTDKLIKWRPYNLTPKRNK